MQAPITFALEDAWSKLCDDIDIPEIIRRTLMTGDTFAEVVTTFAAI